MKKINNSGANTYVPPKPKMRKISVKIPENMAIFMERTFESKEEKDRYLTDSLIKALNDYHWKLINTINQELRESARKKREKQL